MSGAAVPQSVTIPAVLEQVRVARAFVAGVLGECHPHADVALLLASEVVTNSVLHSGSAVPGGLVTLTVAVGGESVRVEVTDHSGDSVPVLRPADDGEAGGGRGMWLVDALAARWGYQRGGGRATTWFELVIDFKEGPGGGGASDREPRAPLREPPVMRAEQDETDELDGPGGNARQVR